MAALSTREFIEILDERAEFYRFLANLYYREVNDDLIDRLSSLTLPEGEESSLFCQGYRQMKEYLVRRGPDPRTDLAVDYARVFLSAGTFEGEAAVPYESIYTSEDGLIMQEARDDVRRIYLEQGVNVDECLNMPEDHLSFELEFLALMSRRSSDLLAKGRHDELRSVFEMQIGFIEDHLENWLPILQDRIEGCAKLTFYPAVVKITRGYVQEDKMLLRDMIEEIQALSLAGF